MAEICSNVDKCIELVHNTEHTFAQDLTELKSIVFFSSSFLSLIKYFWIELHNSSEGSGSKIREFTSICSNRAERVSMRIKAVLVSFSYTFFANSQFLFSFLIQYKFFQNFIFVQKLKKNSGKLNIFLKN
jgi:hypothetical protein